MDLGTIIGLVGGTVLTLVVMIISGSLMMYWDFTSIIVVIGGAVMGTLVKWPIPKFIGGLKAGMKAVFNDVADAEDLINSINDLAQIARKDSVLGLEKVPIENPFLKKAISMAVDGTDPEKINDVLDIEIGYMKKRHADGRGIMEDLAEACPAWGMIGTVIGLVVIMANLTDPSKIGPGLAVALITTLYGALVANLVFGPLAKKLENRSKEEALNMEIIKEGVNSILSGENPRSMTQKLESFLHSASTEEAA